MSVIIGIIGIENTKIRRSFTQGDYEDLIKDHKAKNTFSSDLKGKKALKKNK